MAKVVRPCSMAATIVAKLSSSSTRSAASRATSVPESPIAMPMFASWSAGASLTPSPVMATTCPRLRNARAIFNFSSGETRLTTIPSLSINAPRTSSSCGSSLPSITRPSLINNPTSRAIARAVAGWSPVTIATRIPARRQAAMESATPDLGGSSIPTRPSRTRSFSMLSGLDGISLLLMLRTATATTRKPRSAMRATACCASPISRQRSRTASGAPLTIARFPTMTDIRRRRGSKGNRRIAGEISSSAWTSTLRRRAKTSRETSRGLP